MMIITCKQDEAIVINDDIIVSVVEIRGDDVRLGVEHPTEVPVYRGEVLDAVAREKEGWQRPR